MTFDLDLWRELQTVPEPQEFTLHHYQEKLVNGCRRAIANGQKRIIAYLPTAGGKTMVAMGIVKSAREKGKRVAFVCNRVQLIQQTSEKFTAYGIQHGIIQGANTRDPHLPVVVASIQTLDKRGMDDYDLLILDECHACAGTKAYAEIMRGKITIGLTATPYQKGLGRHHPKLGGPLFESIVAGVTMRELIDTGFLVDADVWAPADPDLRGVKVVAGDYQEDQLGEAMDKAPLVGDIISHWFRLSHNRQTMVFAVNIAHSKHICQQFRDNGILAVHVDYRMTDEEKQDIYADFKAGRSMVLCNCALLSEGADFPACETLILARPTRSKVRFVQMFGRVLRTSVETGKTKAIVLDHSGTVKRLGFPWDFSVTHLDDGKPKKSGGSDKEKPEPLPKACPKCHFMKPPKTPICPGCGFKSERPNEVETEEGELVQLRGKKPKAQVKLQDMGRASIYGQLCQLAHDRSKSEKWVIANFKGIFDTWPRQEYHLVTPTPELLSWIHSKNIAWAKSRKAA